MCAHNLTLEHVFTCDPIHLDKLIHESRFVLSFVDVSAGVCMYLTHKGCNETHIYTQVNFPVASDVLIDIIWFNFDKQQVKPST